ncbi:tetratricopeptide repeat protein [Orientia tsutsugamushi]|uniref:tetratricopeptide repeat protein n=1 Tax=Orientia tsutsugamushi TaxID=784 RepID=UPI002FC9673D
MRYRPNYSEAYHNKGLTLSFLGQLQNAIEHFDLAIKYDHNDATAYCNKGYVLSMLKKYPEAIKKLQFSN